MTTLQAVHLLQHYTHLWVRVFAGHPHRTHHMTRVMHTYPRTMRHLLATRHYRRWLAGWVRHYHRLPGIDLLLGA